MTVYVVTYLDVYKKKVVDVKLYETEALAVADFMTPPTSWRIRKDMDEREVQ